MYLVCPDEIEVVLIEDLVAKYLVEADHDDRLLPGEVQILLDHRRAGGLGAGRVELGPSPEGTA